MQSIMQANCQGGEGKKESLCPTEKLLCSELDVVSWLLLLELGFVQVPLLSL